MWDFKRLLAIAAMGTMVLAAPVGVSAAQVLLFPVATVYLSDHYLNVPVNKLTRTFSGNISNFTLTDYQTGAVQGTFSVRFAIVPAPADIGPYSYNASVMSASWDRVAFPYLTLWTTSGGGGLTVGDQKGDKGNNLYNLFQAEEGFGLAQIYAFGEGVPEPSTWALILVGVGGLGASRRARRFRMRPSA